MSDARFAYLAYDEDEEDAEAASASGLTLALIYTAIGLTMLVSPPFLTVLGVPYDAPHGSFVFKIHPGTCVLLLAVTVAFLERGNPFASLGRAVAGQPAAGLYALSVVVAMFYSTFRYGPSGAAFFVDSLLAPALAALLLAGLSPARQRRLFWFVAAAVLLNGLVGIAEQVARVRLVPLTVAGGVALIEDVFRASALMGHPLANAAVTGFALLTFYGLKRPSMRAAFCLVMLVALLSFGGRAALAIYAGLLALLMVCDGLVGLRRQGIGYGALSGGGAAFVLLVTGLAAAIVYAGIGERIVAKLAWDDSAAVRETGFLVYDYVRLDDLLFGLSPAEIEALIRRVGFTAEVPTLENFWIVITLQLGLVVGLPFVAAFFAFVVHLARMNAWPVRFALLGFILVVSTSNSLSAKTAIFTNVVVLALLAAANTRSTDAADEPDTV